MNWAKSKQAFRSYNYYRKSEFHASLALLPSNSFANKNWTQIAYYRVGLFKTVVQNQWGGKHLKSGIAMAISLASCGETDKAETVVQQLIKRHRFGKYQVMLADALAPLMPELALTLIKHNRAAPLPLRIALLLRTGSHTKAKRLLEEATTQQFKQHPELNLLATNALGGSPCEQITRINQYLQAFNLPALALLNESSSPNPTNLKLAGALPKTDGPLVSILMTAYNAAGRIKPAVESLLAQTWHNLEIIIIDDASSDDTNDVIAELATRDNRIRTLRMPHNVGTYVAKTAGLQLAAGEFITCHDSDDWSHPLRIEKQMQPLLDNPQLIATTSKWVRMEDNGRFYARPVYPLARLNPASPLFRRKQVEKETGLWDAVRTGADSEFYARLQLVFGAKSVKRLQLPLAFGAHREDSLMTSANTGYNAAGIAPTRLAYWEAWNHWHIQELRAGRKPIMTTEERPFVAPPSILVPQDLST